METITIINKSGKVVSTGKHLVNIFKEAKEAYNEKKAEIRADHHQRAKERTSQKLLNARQETQSVASSRHSRRSKASHHRDRGSVSRPPLTDRNLSLISEGSVTSSRRSRSSHHGERSSGSRRNPPEYRSPYLENADLYHPELPRRHTDHVDSRDQTIARRPVPAYTPYRSISNPDFHGNIDMNLAYGDLPPPLPSDNPSSEATQELQASMSKLDSLLLEAHCLQHSATAIIANLQSNPEAMAAVALTLAEISNLLTKMGPGIITALKSSSPAVFALLASPQFLIAGGVAIGVTIVMFGGYKIIKKIQANKERQKEANRMEEALVYEGDLSSIETWRRGIAEVELMSVATSVDGEFITPEAAKQKKERIRYRAREERTEGGSMHEDGSVTSESAVRGSSVRRKEIPIRSSSSRVLVSESGRSERLRKPGKEGREKKTKKSSALTVLFRRSDKGKEKGKEKEKTHRPKVIEI